MVTIKLHTDIPQSKKLAKFLPLESADMCYIKHASSDNPTWRFDDDIPPMILGNVPINEVIGETLPCWSLAALLSVLPKSINNEALSIKPSTALWHIGYENYYTVKAYNAIDACYQLIVYLHELKML